MFTLEQIQDASKKVKSGSDFPQLIQDFKALGIVHYESVVANGITKYFDSEKHSLASKEKYTPILIAENTSIEALKNALLMHQQGLTDYVRFCQQVADAGIYKWVTDVQQMTVSYVDVKGNILLVENIPLPK